MKYRYPFKSTWLSALLFALCLSITLISAVVWSITAATNDSADAFEVGWGSVLPALLTLGTWIACAILARKKNLPVLLWFFTAFWGVELILYILCLTPLYETGMKLAMTIGSLPLWSYFSLVALLNVQTQTASIIVTILPTSVLLGIFLWQIKKLPKKKK